VAWFVARAADGSFLMRAQVEPSRFFTWGELTRLVNQTGVRKNLLLDNKERMGLSTGQVLRGLQRGASLQLWNAEEHSPQVASTCGRLSEELGGEAVRCNVYLSPTSEHVAFHTHHDLLDAFIVQISGAKHWRVWERLVDSPIEVMKDHEQDVPGADPKIDAILEPGDVLFVQRGDPHVAATVGDAPSIHLTIGVRRFTGQDLLEWLVRESKDEAGFRQSWPWGPDGERLDKEPG
jgi:ribosomal protein L16 Arg81 hydroxylase